MAKTFNLNISTPEKQFYLGPVESLIITTTEGEMGILPGHLSMVVVLDVAPIRIKTEEDDWRMAALSGGFVRIKGDEVVILADTAEWPEDIEESRALEAKKRAEERLNAHLSSVEYMRSRVALQRALTRLSVKKG